MKLIKLLSLKNNLTWIIHEKNQAIIIDPGDHNNVLKIINKKMLVPIAILFTHCHEDHFKGIFNLIKYYPINIYGPKKIKGLTINIVKKNIFLLNKKISVLFLPGHTLEHIGFYKKPWLFCGDTMFSGGCGKVYKNNYKIMFNSLKKICSLPNNTIICPGHDYALNNIKFGLSIIPDDIFLKKYFFKMKKKLFNNVIFLTKLGLEKKINLFLRCDDILLKKKLNLMCKKSWEIFQILRKKKDKFN